MFVIFVCGERKIFKFQKFILKKENRWKTQVFLAGSRTSGSPFCVISNLSRKFLWAPDVRVPIENLSVTECARIQDSTCL